MFELAAVTHKRLSSVRSKSTKPEIIVRQFLHSKGFRFRINKKTLPGKPDLVLKKYQSIIFVHGCFWHRHHGCNNSSNPKKNKKYWNDKFEMNISRDKKVQKELKLLGWQVIIMWECELNDDSLDDLIIQLHGNFK